MPSHNLHEKVGCLLGLRIEAVKAANGMIDYPDKFPSLKQFGIRHDDDRLWAMGIIRGMLSQLYGYEGVLAADLHYALDYIDTWLNPKGAKEMLDEIMKNELLLYPRDRKGFVDPVRRLWYESSQSLQRPVYLIVAYCKKCKGVDRPINSPFCNECRVSEFKQGKINEIPEWFLLEMLRKKMSKRKLDPQIRDFVEKNLSTLINWVIEDRRIRGFSSLTVKR
jgi:hypothetical protein